MSDNINDIILEIHNNLTDNKDENIQYLYSLKGKYNDHPHALEIYREIGKLMAENIQNDDLIRLDKSIHQDYDDNMKEALELLADNKIEEAKEKVLNTLSYFQSMYPDYSSEAYFAPNNPIDFQLIQNNLGKESFKTVTFDFSDAYLYLGSISIDLHDYDQARKYMKEGLNLNPYNFELIFEYIETYRIQNNLEKFKENTLLAYDKLYHPQAFARYYRNLGFYYIEAHQFDLAKDLFIHSLLFDRNIKSDGNKIAYNELAYIEQETHNHSLPNGQDIVNTIDAANIPLNISKKNWQVIKDIEEEMKTLDVDAKFKQFISVLNKIYTDIANNTHVHIDASKLS